MKIEDITVAWLVENNTTNVRGKVIKKMIALEGILDKYDVSVSDGKEMVEKYLAHHGNALNKRGEVEFLFSLDEWINWWMQPDDTNQPRWYNRGKSPQNYVMARYCDMGPYHQDNVFLATNNENLQSSRGWAWLDEEVYAIYKKNKARWPHMYLLEAYIIDPDEED